MSLFGITSYMPTTSYNPEEQLKAGQGYNVMIADHEPLYKETKDKYGENLYQPVNLKDETKTPNDFTINDFSRTMQPQYGLHSSYYNNLIGKLDDKAYGTEVFYPQSYPNHYYNTHKFSPIFLALQ